MVPSGNGQPHLIMIEVKLNESYQHSCQAPAYNSTIRGQVELKWRAMRLYFVGGIIETNQRVRYLVETDDLIQFYRNRDGMYTGVHNLADLHPTQGARRLRLVEGVGQFFNDFVDPCNGNIFFLCVTNDIENPLDAQPGLRPQCPQQNGQPQDIPNICWMPSSVLERNSNDHAWAQAEQ